MDREETCVRDRSGILFCLRRGKKDIADSPTPIADWGNAQKQQNKKLTNRFILGLPLHENHIYQHRKTDFFRLEWQRRNSGINKKPTGKPIYLTKNDVVSDEVSNRVNHGGFYKACYLFAAEQYPYWQDLYPDLDWSWGVFGENLTVSGFDEHGVMVGDVYKVGEAVVQVSQYREPCYKLAHKFGTPEIIKQFVKRGLGGTYLSIVEEGYVNVDDGFTLIERPELTLSVAELFGLVFAKEKNQDHLKIAVESRAIPRKKRVLLAGYIKQD